MTGNPVECVVHPDLWNKTKLWDPLGIGRVSIDTYRCILAIFLVLMALFRKESEVILDDEYVEENYGSPINSVSK